MRKIDDPRRTRLVDPFHGLFAPAAVRILQGGWQGPFRGAILELRPVAELARHFHADLGALAIHAAHAAYGACHHCTHAGRTLAAMPSGSSCGNVGQAAARAVESASACVGL